MGLRSFRLSSVLVLGVFLLTSSGVARAEPPLRVPTPQRKVSGAAGTAPSSPPSSAASPAPPPPATASATTSHQKGRAPKTPASELPRDVPLPVADEAARRAIAEGPSREALQEGASDPELSLLRDAEAALFPSPLPGVQPGWSWDLPEPRDGRSSSLGWPLRAPAGASNAELSASDSEWLRSLTLPDLPVRLDRRVVTYLKFYKDSPRGRTIAAIWAKKSGRYLGAMKAELRRAGLPTDLVWLSMIESGHDPVITSPAGAVGLWQFMPHSARMYGLVVDRWVDERRDPARSTQAAVRLLGDLYARFGNWELALAAYNMGYAGLSRSIDKYNTNDYWTLSRLEGGIPWETTLYVPKIFALAVVMNNREAFGLGRIQPDTPIPFDSILVEPGVPLVDVAQAAGVDLDTLRGLNPAYLGVRTPPSPRPSDAAQGASGSSESSPSGQWALRVPKSKGPAVLARLAARNSRAPEAVAARFGETLASLAREYGGSESEWSQLNGITKNERLEQGATLLLPQGAKKTPGASRSSTLVVSRSLEPSSSERLVFYEVRAGDDLEEIAAAFRVAPGDLCRWNAVNPEARLRQGMVLQLVVPRSQSLTHVRYVEPEPGARFLVAGSPEFHEHFEALGGKQRLTIVARAGDTLASLGSRYGMSVGSMERVNRRSRTTKLVPGETIVVYTDKAKAGSAPREGRKELEPLEPPRADLLPPEPAPRNLP